MDGLIKYENPDVECLEKIHFFLKELNDRQVDYILKLQNTAFLSLVNSNLILNFVEGVFAPFFLDYNSLKYRNLVNSAFSSKVAKACGVKKRPVIWDLTCGFGADALVLSSAGANVISCEYNPIIGLMVKFAKWQYGILNNWSIHIADSKEYFVNKCLPDIIYVDQMFPPKPKGRLSQKKMQIISILNNKLELNNDVIDFALSFKVKTVLKLPRKTDTSAFFCREVLGKSIKFIII